jgi:hypothetical protein
MATPGVDRIAAGVDDTVIRERQMKEADTGKLRRHLVDDPVRTLRTAYALGFIPARLIATKLDLNMRRFGRKYDDVPAKSRFTGTTEESSARSSSFQDGQPHLPRCKASDKFGFAGSIESASLNSGESVRPMFCAMPSPMSARGIRRFHLIALIDPNRDWLPGPCRALRHLIASFGRNMITVRSETTHVWVKFDGDQLSARRMKRAHQLTKPSDARCAGEEALPF